MTKRLDFLLFRFLAGIRHRLTRRCTRAGALALVVVAVSAGIGVDTTMTLTYQIFTFSVALVLVGIAGAWTFRGKFAVRRVLPDFATVGEPLVYRVEITNHGRNTQAGLRVLETLVDHRPNWDAFSREPGKSFAAWKRLLSRNVVSRIPESELPPLAPGETVRITKEFVPSRRGAIEFESVTVARCDPFGLFKGFVHVRARQTMLVLPRRYTVPEIALPGFRRYQHGGVTQATSVGDSEEFLGLRDYRDGDPLQRIHWKSFARVGKPIVKEYQDEFFERHALALDTFSEDEEIVEEAVSVAASLACTVDTQESLLDLLFVDGTSYCYTLGRGQHHVESLLEVLAHVRSSAPQGFSELHDAVVGRRPELSGCVLLFAAWDAQRRALVESLQASGLPVLAFVISRATDASTDTDFPDRIHPLSLGHIQEGLVSL